MDTTHTMVWVERLAMKIKILKTSQLKKLTEGETVHRDKIINSNQ